MSGKAKVTLLEGFTKIFRHFLQELHQSEVILDYAFSIKTESISDTQDCVSILVTALQDLQNGINDIIVQSQRPPINWCKEEIISPLNEVPLDDPFHDAENFVSDETQQLDAAGLLVHWDDKHEATEDPVIVIKNIDKDAASLEVLNSVFDAVSEKSWTESEPQEPLDEVQQFECLNCNETFSDAGKLEAHRAKNHTLPTACDLCGKALSSVSALQAHCKKEHGGAGCFSCPTCKKRFMLRLSYDRHLKTHNPSLTAVCEICGKAFKRADYMKRHYMMHSQKKPHKCDKCEKTFSNPSSLKIHKNQVHDQVKEHSCEKCGKKFARADKLKDHMKRHDNVRSHSCEFCGRKYVEKRDLRKHLEKCGMNKSVMNKTNIAKHADPT